jgi:uncharacterized protein with FMN-binding domain
VQDHKITEIEILEHHHGRDSAREAEVLPSRMIEQQRTDVDIISGSTSSGKVIMEAVYNALTGQRTMSR